jgi:hypothetical protein
MPARHDPEADPQRAPPLPPAARHLPPARDEEKSSRRGRFAETEIGYVHIDVCELRLAAGKLRMFLAIDRVSKFTYVEFHEAANTTTGPAFLRNVVAAFPYQIRIVLTDNGTPFADLPKNRSGPTARWRGHMFDRVCREHGIGAPAHQALPPLDQRPGRADEPDHQGRHRKGVPLRGP